MGCLNSHGQFKHWFANIHLSGPCNRACYFCIGQHMMALDPFNNLDRFPLDGMDRFLESCLRHGVREVNLTGSNTDPLLYRHLPKLATQIREALPGVTLGIRTNGALVMDRLYEWSLFDKASISVTSLDPALYLLTMGKGSPPPIKAILAQAPRDVKVNIVLCPETVHDDLFNTIAYLEQLGVRKVNLREPYGQPHIGDPLQGRFIQAGTRYGMPMYESGEMEIVYWDVHFVEVESVNLYANGIVSETYPVTKGHDPVAGKVIPQGEWIHSGRQHEQWLVTEKV